MKTVETSWRVRGKTGARLIAPARRWVRRAVWLIGAYVLTVVVLVAGEDRMAFRGWTFKKPWLGPPAGVTVDDLALATSEGDTIHAWWLPTPGWTSEKGAVLYFHGSGGNVSTYGKALASWSKELETAALGLDYPGYGHSTGTPNERSCSAAAQRAFDYLVREKKVAPHAIIVIGQSMGGALATEIASRQPCRMLITSGAFTSFPDAAQAQFFWLPARYLVHTQFNSIGKIRAMQTPVFITHGTADHVVPFEEGERLYEAAREPKRFYPIPEHHHAQPKTPEFYEAVRQFLRETERFGS